MKRLFSIIFIISILHTLAACGNESASVDISNTANPSISTDETLSATFETSPLTEAPTVFATQAPNENETELVEYATYPLNPDSTYVKLASSLPAKIYSTTGSENGLGGTVYTFSGTVTDYFTTDADSFVFESIVVDTGDGKAVVSNYYKAIYNATLLQFGYELTNAYYPYNVKDYILPNVGETVSFVVVYMGYSEVEKAPIFVLGANPSIFEMLDYEDPTTQQETTPATETMAPPSSETEYKPTKGEQNALSSAKSYLRVSSFSYYGLIDQLEYEGYTADEATYAADNCGADWNAQALKSAKSYLDFSAFSYSGLIDQLEYEKYTNEEATYAADNCGADWYEQAVKCAESYLSFSNFSRQGLIDQLIYEGFTQDQAVHGVEANGY